jgi:hypothetical protein
VAGSPNKLDAPSLLDDGFITGGLTDGGLRTVCGIGAPKIVAGLFVWSSSSSLQSLSLESSSFTPAGPKREVLVPVVGAIGGATEPEVTGSFFVSLIDSLVIDKLDGVLSTTDSDTWAAETGTECSMTLASGKSDGVDGCLMAVDGDSFNSPTGMDPKREADGLSCTGGDDTSLSSAVGSSGCRDVVVKGVTLPDLAGVVSSSLKSLSSLSSNLLLVWTPGVANC